MKKTMITLLAMLWLGNAAYAQAVPKKTKTRNREQQGVIMSDSPNTIAPVTPADRTGNNNNGMPRTNPPTPAGNTPGNNTNQPNGNSMDTQPLNGNSNGRIERNPDLNRGDGDRSTIDMLNNNQSMPMQPPPTK